MNFQNFVKNIDTKLESGLITEANDSKKISFVKDWKKTVGNKLSQGVQNWKQSVSDQWTKGDPITPNPKLRNLRDILLTTVVLSGAMNAKDEAFPPHAAPYEHVIDRNRDSAVELMQNDLKNKGFNVRPETLKKVYDETPKEEMDKVLQHMRQYNILAEGVGEALVKAGEKVVQNPAVRQKAYAAFMAAVLGAESLIGGAVKSAENVAVKEVVPAVASSVEKSAVKSTLADIEAQMAKNAVKAPEKMTASGLLKKSMEKAEAEDAARTLTAAEKDAKFVKNPDVQKAASKAQQSETVAVTQQQVQAAQEQQIQKAQATQSATKNAEGAAKVAPSDAAIKERMRGRYPRIPFGKGQDDDYIYPLQPNGEEVDAGDLTTDIRPFSKWASATVQTLKI